MRPEYFHFESVGSTNTAAKELLRQHDFVFVTADFQTHGRGRNGRSWFGDAGKNFFCSAAIRHREKKTIEELLAYQYRACLSVLSVLRKTFPHQCFALKYPNDVYALEHGKGKKISGVLIENEFQGERCTTTVIGVGVNLSQRSFPPELEDTATSLLRLGEEISTGTFREKFLPVFQQYLASGLSDILFHWKHELNLTGKNIYSLQDRSEYIVQGFDATGRIIAANGDTRRIFDNGDSIRYEVFD